MIIGPITRPIQIVHLETTDVCQARCPLCARETDPGFDAKNHHHLTIQDIQNILPDTVITGLNKVFACGNYGDPAAGKHTLEIFKFFRDKNPNIVLGMNTNGGLQNTRWWSELATIFNQNLDYVVFSIDGLEDTNHIYRIGVNWQRVMDNVQAFILAGGKAHWDMLVYAHNEHQVDLCEQQARDLGFTWFRVKVSKRPLINNLRHPQLWKPHPAPNKPIKCQALADQSIYIDALGRISPCCWIGSDEPGVAFDHIKPTWDTQFPHPTCLRNCGTIQNNSSFEHQWRREIALK